MRSSGDSINYQAVSALRDKALGSPSATLGFDFANASQSLQQFSADETEASSLKWKRDKFDNQFVKYIHKYFIANKSQKLDEGAYRDLHFMTNKYLELVGSVEFNSYMQQTLNQKLGL